MAWTERITDSKKPSRGWRREGTTFSLPRGTKRRADKCLRFNPALVYPEERRAPEETLLALPPRFLLAAVHRHPLRASRPSQSPRTSCTGRRAALWVALAGFRPDQKAPPHQDKPSPTRDCTADSVLRSPLRRFARQAFSDGRRRGKARSGSPHEPTLPPSQETGEVRSPRDFFPSPGQPSSSHA